MNLESEFQAKHQADQKDHRWFEGCFVKETRKGKDLTGYIFRR